MEIIPEKKPLVSVIIDTYNYGHFIEEAIDSVLNQNFPLGNLEIIVVDDGSTDDTHEKVKKYKDKIHYIYKNNGGQASALNVGIEKAKGEIIAFLDSDDYWDPHKLEVVVAGFQKYESVDIIYHDLHLIDNQRNIIKTLFGSLYPCLEKRKDAYGHKHVNLGKYLKGKSEVVQTSTSGMSIRTRCLKKIVPIPEHYRICADGYMHIFSQFHARDFFLIKEPLGCYRIHEKNLFSENSIFSTEQVIVPERLRKLISYTLLNIQDIQKYGQHSGQDIRKLKKMHENFMNLQKDELEGKKFTFSQIKILFNAHYLNIRYKGLAQCIADSYHYRKGRIHKWMKRSR